MAAYCGRGFVMSISRKRIHKFLPKPIDPHSRVAVDCFSVILKLKFNFIFKIEPCENHAVATSFCISGGYRIISAGTLYGAKPGDVFRYLFPPDGRAWQS